MDVICGDERSKQEREEGYIGVEAYNKKSILNLKYPVEKGRVVDWDALEKLWRYCYKERGVEPENHPVLLSDSPLVEDRQREKMAGIIFETFDAPSLYIEITACLSLISTGRTTGR